MLVVTSLFVCLVVVFAETDYGPKPPMASIQQGASIFDDSHPLLNKASPYSNQDLLQEHEDVEWNPEIHLQLEAPEQLIPLSDLGYENSITAFSRIAYSTAFRLLSPAGVDALGKVLRTLQRGATSSERISSMVRGGVLRSKFIRGLSLEPRITEFVGRHLNVSIIPHTILHQLGHVNFAPKELGRAVDLWHCDNIPVDYVLFCTSTLDIKGGAFEVFRGTRQEAAHLHSLNLTLPTARVHQIKAPAGYAVLLQGHHVVHRAAPLLEIAERITFVNSFVPRQSDASEASKPKILRAVDQEHVVAAEVCGSATPASALTFTNQWSVHRALRAKAQLVDFLHAVEYNRPTEFYLRRLKAIRNDLDEAIEMLSDGNVGEEHFGGKHDNHEPTNVANDVSAARDEL